MSEQVDFPLDVIHQKTSINDLIGIVLSDIKISPEQKILLIDELRKNNAGFSDRWAYRWSVWILGGSILLTILCISLLAGIKGSVPEGLYAIGTGVVGALAGLLSPTRKSPNENSNE